MPPYAQLLVIVLALVAFWAVVMRPARNQQRKIQEIQRELVVGEEIVLSAGIFGTIRSLTETRAEVEVAPGTVITVARQVVVRRVEDLPEDHANEVPEPDEPTRPAHPDDPTVAED